MLLTACQMRSAYPLPDRQFDRFWQTGAVTSSARPRRCLDL